MTVSYDGSLFTYSVPELSHFSTLQQLTAIKRDCGVCLALGPLGVAVGC